MDYVSNVLPATFPDGLDTEVFSFEILDSAFEAQRRPFDLEHVVPWMEEASRRGGRGIFCGPADFSHLRWTLDEPEDYAFIKEVYEDLFPQERLSAGWMCILADQGPG